MRHLWILFFFAVIFSLHGQNNSSPRFRGGITAGITAAANLSERNDLMIEILYSQRGSTQKLIKGTSDQIQKYFLNYVEVPLLFGLKDWYNDELEDYRLQFFGGISYGRLINGTVNFSAEHRELLTDANDTQEEIDNDRFIIDRNANLNDYAWILGFNFFINKNAAASFRYTSSLNYIWKLPQEPGPGENFDSLRSFFLTFRYLYLF